MMVKGSATLRFFCSKGKYSDSCQKEHANPRQSVLFAVITQTSTQ